MQAVTVAINPPDFQDFDALHDLLQGAFSEMEGRIDPPSSMTRLDVAGLRAKAQAEDLLIIRTPDRPIACVFGQKQGWSYYIGKLAVAKTHRRLGLARRLIDAAALRAQVLGCTALTLQTRVELVENHITFARLGFVQTGAEAHPGYDRPTSLSFRRLV